jgi:uncharacterized membrane protein
MINKFKDKDMQAVIGWVLRAGVFISMIVVFIGGVIYYTAMAKPLQTTTKFKGVPDFVHSPAVSSMAYCI